MPHSDKKAVLGMCTTRRMYIKVGKIRTITKVNKQLRQEGPTI
jgi:hypothetical protein